jgi:hypothetical protein
VPHVQGSFKLAEVAYHFVRVVYDHLDDPPPPKKNFSGYARDIVSELIFCPYQPICHSEPWVRFWVSQYFTAHSIRGVCLPEQFREIYVVFHDDT